MTFNDYQQRVKAARRSSAFYFLGYFGVVMAFFIVFLLWVAEDKRPWTPWTELAVIVGAVVVPFLPLILLRRNGRKLMSRYGFRCPNCNLELMEYNTSEFVLEKRQCPQCDAKLFDGQTE